jgi:dTMP kinase
MDKLDQRPYREIGMPVFKTNGQGFGQFHLHLISLKVSPLKKKRPDMFITLEGIEGSGKSTQIRAIAQWLSAAGRELPDHPRARRYGHRRPDPLRSAPSGQPCPGPTAELLLYVADRVQHLETVVRPALAAGKVVVCDRYFDATLVYQGYARGLDRG